MRLESSAHAASILGRGASAYQRQAAVGILQGLGPRLTRCPRSALRAYAETQSLDALLVTLGRVLDTPKKQEVPPSTHALLPPAHTRRLMRVRAKILADVIKRLLPSHREVFEEEVLIWKATAVPPGTGGATVLRSANAEAMARAQGPPRPPPQPLIVATLRRRRRTTE